jgi:hypothetical protein
MMLENMGKSMGKIYMELQTYDEKSTRWKRFWMHIHFLVVMGFLISVSLIKQAWHKITGKK